MIPGYSKFMTLKDIQLQVTIWYTLDISINNSIPLDLCPITTTGGVFPSLPLNDT
jgi:hypothetical protein